MIEAVEGSIEYRAELKSNEADFVVLEVSEHGFCCTHRGDECKLSGCIAPPAREASPSVRSEGSAASSSDIAELRELGALLEKGARGLLSAEELRQLEEAPTGASVLLDGAADSKLRRAFFFSAIPAEFPRWKAVMTEGGQLCAVENDFRSKLVGVTGEEGLSDSIVQAVSRRNVLVAVEKREKKVCAIVEDDDSAGESGKEKARAALHWLDEIAEKSSIKWREHVAIRHALLENSAVVEGVAALLPKGWAVGKGVMSYQQSGASAKKQRQDKRSALRQHGVAPSFFLCTLYKVNMTTSDAVNMLAGRQEVGDEHVHLPLAEVAGTKDKRAVTTQYVTLDGLRCSRPLEEGWTFTKEGGRGRETAKCRMRVLRQCPSPLQLGRLEGNIFIIRLRNVARVDGQPVWVGDVDRKGSTLSSAGFVNYYGEQRFGDSPARHVDALVSVLREVRAKEGRGKRRRIGHREKSLSMHSVGSHIFNKLAEARCNRVGFEVEAGDVVCSEGKLQVVSSTDVSRFQCKDVMLPLFGHTSLIPQNKTGELYVHLLQSTGVLTKEEADRAREEGSLSFLSSLLGAELRRAVGCALPGGHRSFLAFPTSLSDEDRENLSLGPFVKREEGAAGQTDLALSFMLPSSCYATVFLAALGFDCNSDSAH